MKEKIIRKIIISITKTTHFEGYTISQGLAPSIFTAAPPQYLSSCFPLAFLEGHCPFLSLVAISLYLDPIT